MVMLLAALLATAAPEPGTLVIAGGGVEPGNEEIYGAFLEARAQDRPTILIIAAASSVPQQSFDSAREALVRHGADADDIELLNVALVDDPATQDVDEASWRADNPELVQAIGAAGAIWFTGGDQVRLEVLLGPGKPLLNAIRQAHLEGMAIGGTSAGAAIMGTHMIRRGDPVTALLPDAEGEQLSVGAGLAFLGIPFVDQHFGERARLGRLAAALCTMEPARRLGLGIDEDTALVVRGSAGRVVGTGEVTLLDGRRADCNDDITDLSLGVASAGDRVELGAPAIRPASWREPVVGAEAYDAPTRAGGGMLLPQRSLGAMLGRELLDNEAAGLLERTSIVNDRLVTYRFTQTATSSGHWGRDVDGSGRYAIIDVRFDIERP